LILFTIHHFVLNPATKSEEIRGTKKFYVSISSNFYTFLLPLLLTGDNTKNELLVTKILSVVRKPNIKIPMESIHHQDEISAQNRWKIINRVGINDFHWNLFIHQFPRRSLWWRNFYSSTHSYEYKKNRKHRTQSKN
jgi:hypothetical protein